MDVTASTSMLDERALAAVIAALADMAAYPVPAEMAPVREFWRRLGLALGEEYERRQAVLAALDPGAPDSAGDPDGGPEVAD